jgi:hypothetical protein
MGDEIGRMEKGDFISHKHLLAGTEQAIAYVAIAAALSMQSQFRILLLDELGRVDTDNKAKLLTLIAQAQQDGVIDQAIAIDVARLPELMGCVNAGSEGDRTVNSLNPEQQMIVDSRVPITIGIAGPGSGKSHTLAACVPPAAFGNRTRVIITYTNAAAKVIRDRIGPSNARYVGTLHGYMSPAAPGTRRPIGLPPGIDRGRR